MNPNIKELQKLSKLASEQMQSQVELLDNLLTEGLKTLKKEDADELQKVKNNIEKAIRLAKEGKQKECNDILSSYGYSS